LAEENKIKAGFKDLEAKFKDLEAELKKSKEELELQTWGLNKTNETIKFLYRELDQKNKELQKLDKLKTDFINIASHELRTPLTIIKEAISQILDGIHGQITPGQKKGLTICFGNIERLRHLVDDLLDISKIEAGKLKLKKEWIDLVGLAREVGALFQPKAKNIGLELKENFSSPTAMAYVDKDNVIRVFTNLISNALKFTEQGHIEILVTDKPDCVECQVADTGRGVSEEDAPRVFGKFEQFGDHKKAKEKGTGLGLNICKKIVELHHGEIWMESILGKGSTFTFTFPKNFKEENQSQDSNESISS
jgi:two-component system sensor histidine kinase ChiS